MGKRRFEREAATASNSDATALGEHRAARSARRQSRGLWPHGARNVKTSKNRNVEKSKRQNTQ